jgi:hypothetical protein
MFTLFLILLLVLVSGIAVAIVGFVWDRQQKSLAEIDFLRSEMANQTATHKQALARYLPIVNLDQEFQRVQAAILQLQADFQAYSRHYQDQRNQLAAEYQQSKGLFDQLKRELASIEGSLDDVSFGIYRPYFSFDTSEQFKTELERVRNAKKQLIRSNQATTCIVEWTVQGSRKEGARMQSQLAKLMLRAFNGESDAAIANVSWNNATKMEERLKYAFEAINKLGTVMQVSVTREYLDLALCELRLKFEYEEKRQQEKEEQRALRERMREEERAQRELQRAEQDATDDETRYQKLLAKAKADAAQATGERFAEIAERMRMLEADLAEAQARKERAISMAQLTRCGYIYIISNIGSFGEDTYKLGLTRRLDPMDRVRELSDASVPFNFDVHGMIYSENAPDLERELHQHFAPYRVNLINPRREFFRVTLDMIREFLDSRGIGIELTMLAEAREYRESRVLREGIVESEEVDNVVVLPDAI